VLSFLSIFFFRPSSPSHTLTLLCCLHPCYCACRSVSLLRDFCWIH